MMCCSRLQCYLKDAAARIETDMRRAAVEGWRFGAKTVRGAYMVVERARAAERGYDSPIWDTLQETHDSYNRRASHRAWLKPVSHMGMRGDASLLRIRRGSPAVTVLPDNVEENVVLRALDGDLDLGMHAAFWRALSSKRWCAGWLVRRAAQRQQRPPQLWRL